MNDAEFRELTKKLVMVDYKLTFVINLLSQVLPEMKHGGAPVTLKQLLDARADGFSGPSQNAVTDQVIAEIKEATARYKKDKPARE